jgi:hypothetical protein
VSLGSLDDYNSFADVSAGVNRMVRFLTMDLVEQGGRIEPVEAGLFEVRDSSGVLQTRFTTDRDRACGEESLDLLGLDHPLIQHAVARRAGLSPGQLGATRKTRTRVQAKP